MEKKIIGGKDATSKDCCPEVNPPSKVNMEKTTEEITLNEIIDVVDFTINQMSKEANVTCSKSDYGKQGQIMAYSHCCIELMSIKDKLKQYAKATQPSDTNVAHLPQATKGVSDTNIAYRAADEGDVKQRQGFVNGAKWMRDQLSKPEQ
jgi:hypothetical protein